MVHLVRGLEIGKTNLSSINFLSSFIKTRYLNLKLFPLFNKKSLKARYYS